MKKANKRLKIKAPFFYFGGKSMIAELVWKLLGKDIKRYFEPFAGRFGFGILCASLGDVYR